MPKRQSLAAKILALLAAHAVAFTCLAPDGPAQEQRTRPRRVGVETAPSVARPAPPVEQSAPSANPQGDAVAEPVGPEDEQKLVRLDAEPLVRVGLATDARSATISSEGRLLSALDANLPPTPLDVARVRVEPRTLPPSSGASPTDGLLADAADDADSPDDGRASNQADSSRTKTDGRRAGGGDEKRRGAAGSAISVRGGANRESSATARSGAEKEAGKAPAGGVRLASRAGLPVRAAVVYTVGSAPLFDARAPLTFSSADEASHPIKFNEKSYRGLLEVFVNMRGTLTIVNVVRLEDYVRGVVANELSPGGFPAMEALKAQAVAARTYAVSNRNNFAREGFDLLPTTRSQVYGGLSTEHPMTDRAVEETRGRVATYKGRPINALYTSTCGGRTEDAENIFGGEPVPYLRGRACMVEDDDRLDPHTLRTSRDRPSVRDAEHASSARDAALLAVHGFHGPPRLTDEWLAEPLAPEELRALLSVVSILSRRPAPAVSNELVRPGSFSTALARTLDGESRGDVLMNPADVEYFLSFRDADEIPAANRADVAQLLREGHLALYPDATLRPKNALTRARALRAVARALESRGLFSLQKATTRPASKDALVVRQPKGPDRSLRLAGEAHLFRAYGDALYPVREVALVGGEAVTFHTGAGGEVDYLEVRPAPGGAASDRSSTYAHWTVTLTPQEAMSRLGRHAGSVGALLDLHVRARGTSRRVLDLEVVGTKATAHVRGGRVRTALGLREQLFVIDRRRDDGGRVTAFVFTGRGWGHGVGMCQVGAYGLARAGLSYEKILKSYYTDIDLTKFY